MHQIEEILKQLNEKSAVIQPGTVELLSSIQDRLMRRSQTTAMEEGQQELILQEETSSAQSQEEEISPLLRSIVDSNRKLRGDHEQTVSQPRFLSQKPVSALNSVAAEAVEMTTSSNLDAATFSDSIDSASAISDSADYADSSGYTLDRATDYGFQLNDVPSLDQSAEAESTIASEEMFESVASSIGLSSTQQDSEEHVSLKFPGSATPETKPSEVAKSQSQQSSDQLSTAREKTVPPPVPHFDRATQTRYATANDWPAHSQTDSRLPIFDSAWFRRNAPTKPIGTIVESIMLKIPPVAPATLQFTQCLESKADGAKIATQVAWELSRRVQGDVLLVDADFQLREVSRQLENVYVPGLGEILNRDEAAAGLIRKTGVDRLYWLPSGQSDVSYRKTTSDRWSRISAELKKQFQYICIYSGSGQEKVATTWGRFCDFTFLIASMTDDLGPDTEDLIVHLRKNDSRIAGLITVD